MIAANDKIVTVNTGSSSIKLAVFAKDQNTSKISRLLDASINNIGQSVSTLEIRESTMPVQIKEVSASSHSIALHILIERLTDIVVPNSIIAVGHRLVHGGITYTGSTLVENISETDWKLLEQLDPGHTPAAHQLIAQFAERYPAIRQVACFDTAFFHDLPHIAKVIPIPQKYYTAGVRRYGFHGLSYTSLLATFRDKAGVTAANGRVIFAHLGSGASLAATHMGKPVDTTMSFTPASGVTMSTRSGDLDPSIFGFLHQQNNMSVDEFNHMINFQSGLLGISNLTGDMHALLAVETDNKDAATAIELFVRDVKKAIGSLSATLGGVDSLIFSGGIGEQSAVLRARICKDLGYLGIEIDETANTQNAFLISSEHSKSGVHVIATDEARVIAIQTNELLQTAGKG